MSSRKKGHNPIKVIFKIYIAHWKRATNALSHMLQRES